MIYRNRKNVLVLSGGGSNGDYQSGVISALWEGGFRFDHVTGISVGGLNGILTALGQVETLKNVWWNLDESIVLKRRGRIRIGGSYLLHKIGIHNPPMGYYSNSPLYQTLQDRAQGVLRSGFTAGVVNANTGEYTDYHIPRKIALVPPDKRYKWILATTAIPGIFDPVQINGSWYVDGGVVKHMPISNVLPSDPDRVILISTRRKGRRSQKEVKDIVGIATSSLLALMEESFDADIRQFRKINHLVEQAERNGLTLTSRSGNRYKYYDEIYFEPEESLGDSMEFTKEKARKNFEIGYEQAQKQLTQLRHDGRI